jgi:HEPN domain-containing protein
LDKITIVKEWIVKAEQDYTVIQQLQQSDNPVWDAIGFHAQQCAEKYFKAYLVMMTQDVPKTHDLDTLYRLCQPYNRVWQKLEHVDWDFLTMGAVESRYPGVILSQTICEQMLNILEPLRELSKTLLQLQ